MTSLLNIIVLISSIFIGFILAEIALSLPEKIRHLSLIVLMFVLLSSVAYLIGISL